jgi:predicted nucleic acid-binding Zn ribbon protein
MTKQCAYCGKEFRTYTKLKKYCSTKCYYDVKTKARKDKQDKTIDKKKTRCRVCSKEFIPNGLRTKTCSTDCSKEYARRAKRAYYNLNKQEINSKRRKNIIGSTRTCVCGKKFTVKAGVQKYCSQQCKIIANGLEPREKDRRKSHIVFKAKVKALNERATNKVSDFHKEIKKLAQKGYSPMDISYELKVNYYTLRGYCTKNNISFRFKDEKYNAKKAIIKNNLQKG